jgi:polyisoprenoid-binding protein YceI
MSRALAVVLCFLTAYPPNRLFSQPIRTAPLRSGDLHVALKASTVSDFNAVTTISTATYTGSDLSNVTGALEFRVAAMQTGIGLRDRHMRNAMHADSFPVIRFDLTQVQPGATRGDTLAVVFAGRLTMHGVSRNIQVQGTVVLHAITGGAEVSTATFPVDMREYNIVPPSRFLGAVKVDPIMQVRVRLSFGS